MTIRTWQRVKYSVELETHVFYVDVADDSEDEQMRYRGSVYREGEMWTWTVSGVDAFTEVAGLDEGKAAVEAAEQKGGS